MRQDAFLGRGISGFSTGSYGESTLAEGWHAPESWGVWASLRRSVLRFSVPTGCHCMLLSCRFPPNTDRGKYLRISINHSDCMIITSYNAAQSLTIPLTVPECNGHVERVYISFDSSDFGAECGNNNDSRWLGIGIENIRVVDIS
jgi:hypothetical protein